MQTGKSPSFGSGKSATKQPVGGWESSGIHSHVETPEETASAVTRAAQMRVLVVDDDLPVRRACAEIAAGLGFSTQAVDSMTAAKAALAGGGVDVVLLGLKLPGSGGMTLLKEIRKQHPEAVVVVMTAFATVSSAVEAMRMGAGDYMTKPFTLEELSVTLGRAAQRRTFDVETRSLRERLRAGQGMGNLIGRSPAMEKLYRILSKVARSIHPVLIQGESGAGKEIVARSIHLNGPSAAMQFIPVDCGSLAPKLIESELFGYTKGAFTGVERSKTGLLASAEGGTVFLNEIGELPLELQTKLLRALQEKEVRPVGSMQAVPLHARILAATNRDLNAMVASGKFRKDLFFRLNVVSLRIPPLRERKEDIPLLAAHVVEKLARDKGIRYLFSDDALRLMMEYDWPGNVRELEHAIERAMALSSGPVLHMADFPTQLQDFQRHAEAREQSVITRKLDVERVGGSESGERQVVSIAEMEKQAILNTIQQLKGDKLMAAKLLGIGKTTLYRKLKEYEIGGEG
jgi:two-component system response regulator HydG